MSGYTVFFFQPENQPRQIVAVRTEADAAEAFQCSLDRFRERGGVSSNRFERRTALTVPLAVFSAVPHRPNVFELRLYFDDPELSPAVAEFEPNRRPESYPNRVSDPRRPARARPARRPALRHGVE